jgi:23S rRNA (guanosine2251-2'-O)-methyltransferase
VLLFWEIIESLHISFMSDTNKIAVYGKKVVLELLRSNHPVKQIILARESENQYRKQITFFAEKRNLAINFVPKKDIQKYCGPVLHQGIAALIDRYDYMSETAFARTLQNEKNPLIVILDQIQDPHNLGAIIRSAEASGVNMLVLPRKGSSEITPTVAKTSAGAVFHLPIYYCNDFYDTLQFIKQMNLKIIGLHPGTGDTIYETDMKNALALIVGSEGTGIRKNVLRYCDQTVKIPQRGKVNSLNASVAAAVTLYEILRQRSMQNTI